MGKHKKRSFDENEVIKLGGSKDDYNFLKNVDENEDLESDVEQNEDESNIKSEVKELLKSFEKEGKEKKNSPEKKSQVNKHKKEWKTTYVAKATLSGEDTANTPKNEIKLKIPSFRKVSLIRTGEKWHQQLLQQPNGIFKNPADIVSELERLAEQVLESDKTLYKHYLNSRSEKSDFKWVQMVISKGTLSDKISAYTVLIQDSAVHNLNHLQNMISMVTPKGKKECLMAIDALRDLFLSDLLKEEEKLKYFNQQPLSHLDELASGNRDARDKRLIMWCFEDRLKKAYRSFLEALEKASFDNVEKLKQKAVSSMFTLLTYNPEQEQYLLSKLVNKLGDPSHRVASHVSHYLNKLVVHHTQMKPVVVDEVEHLLYRPNINPKAQYYALCFLSQVLLSDDESTLAGKLVKIYFGFFKKCVQTGEADTKMMSALLTGVHRAFPYTKNSDMFKENLDTLFKLVHLGNFNISIQALMLIFQVLTTTEDLTDRFYCALYKKLLDPQLEHSSHQLMFLNIVYKALKRDTEDRRVKAFIKRLLQICMFQMPHLASGILILVSQILKAKSSLMNSVNLHTVLEDDDGEEHYEDIPDDEDDLEDLPRSTSKENSTVKSSWVHSTNLKENPTSKSKFIYDPLHRNPLYCGAEYSLLWEFRNLSCHYHPTAELFTSQILKKQSISYSGDPLEDFSLMHFLDRFVYRNPKKSVSEKSKNEVHQVFSKQTQYVPVGVRKLAVNSKLYLNQSPEVIPVEERYLYRYFLKAEPRPKKRKKDDDSDIESVASDDFDRFLENYEPGGKDITKLDFASEFINKKAKKKKPGKDDSDDNEDEFSSGEDDELEELEDDDELDESFEDMEEDLPASEKGAVSFQEEDVAFSDDDEFESTAKKGAVSGHPKSKTFKDHPALQKSSSRKSEFDIGKLLVSADEFSSMLEENSGPYLETTTSQALSNKDKAGVKQLKWETDRDKWIRGADWRSMKRKKMHGNFRKPRITKKPLNRKKKK